MELYALEEIGKDELNNPINEPVLVGLYRGKITHWTTEEIALLDREITRTQKKLLTDVPLNIIKQAKQIKINDGIYTIVDVKSDYVRWRLCHVKEYFT
jgi:hypothetical protein